MKIDTLANFHY